MFGNRKNGLEYRDGTYHFTVGQKVAINMATRHNSRIEFGTVEAVMKTKVRVAREGKPSMEFGRKNATQWGTAGDTWMSSPSITLVSEEKGRELHADYAAEKARKDMCDGLRSDLTKLMDNLSLTDATLVTRLRAMADKVEAYQSAKAA